MFYAIINYPFKTSDLKNVEKLVKQTIQIRIIRIDWQCAFCTICEIVFLVAGP